MSNNTKIFSEAIAEAKAIRETAMANAKLALEEAFAPRIQEMMSDKLEAMSQEDEMEEGYGKEMEESNMENMEEISLEELLSELEGLEEGEEEMEEGIGSAIKGAASNVSKGLEKAYDKIANAKPLFNDEPLEKFSKKFRKVMSGDEKGYGLNREGVDEDLTEAEDDDEVGTISVDELKDIIRDIMADVMGGGEEMEADEEMETGEEMEAGEDDLELEEILAEIASLEEGDEEEMEEGIGSAIKGAAQKVGSAIKATVGDGGKLDQFIDKGSAKLKKAGFLDSNMTKGQRAFEGEELDEYGSSTMREPSDSAAAGLDNIIKGLKNLIAKGGPIAAKAKAALEDLGAAAGAAMRAEGEAKELDEALATVAELRTQLQEVNLLNAKLLYVNKVFKANNLTESQKVNVVAAFDKAETVKEVKLVFETVSKNVVAKPATIKEHKSFASKAAGTAATAGKKEIISEVSEQVARWQKLAGIIK